MSKSPRELRDEVLDFRKTPFEQLVTLFGILRSEQGCAWDRKQTHESLVPYLHEESYEVVAAIESRLDSSLEEELGDLLCQIVFHAQLANERRAFSMDSVITRVVEKLVQRHPHVFEERRELSSQGVRDQWEKRKVSTGEKPSLLSGIPLGMPALTLAYRIGEKAAGVGFDWSRPTDVIAKIREELAELEQEHERQGEERDQEALKGEIGDLLFAIASYARKEGIDAESALRMSVRKFKRRFELMEQSATSSSKPLSDFSAADLDALWEKAKKEGR